jgi:DNA-binding MarR family transcriptional regulator
MTRTVQGLEAAGLVEREADPNDGRIVNIRATPTGIEVLQAARARRVSALAGALETLSEAERRTLQRAAVLLEELASA